MTTFISYSRVNSAFVVRLAKDLKTAGFDVWLDQLDIPKGARWDDEIEAAVERSSTFMIVLAPESIESQNVKDELSYAIDAGKHILPVVIRPCKIPLRLRRFQYVDFTDKPYKDSLSDIKHLLSNTKQIPRVVEEKPYYEREDPVAVVKGPLISHEPSSLPEPIPSARRVDFTGVRKFTVPVLLAVIGIAAVTGIVAYAGNRNTPIPVTGVTITPNPPTITSTSTTIPPAPQITDKYGVTMRLVPAGEFIMGSDTGLADEQPVQTVYLDAFYIDKYEVSNALYRDCVAAGACPPPNKVNSVTHVAYYSRPDFDSYPVVFVDWNMARSFCAWRGGRLPTEAEWEKAARGTDGRTYPMGEAISCDAANYSGCQSDTSAVTDYGVGLSPYGIHNMAGNVYEWVSSLYMPYPYDPIDGREESNTSGDRVIRGGSWIKANSETEVRSARRQRADPTLSTENIGFRCVSIPNTLVPVTGPATATPRNGSTATAMAATNHVRKTKESLGLLSTPVPPTSTMAGPTTIQGFGDSRTIEPTIETPTDPPIVTRETTTVPPTEPPIIVTTEPPPTDPPTEPPTEPPAPTDPPVPPDPPTDPPPTDPPAAPTDPPAVQ